MLTSKSRQSLGAVLTGVTLMAALTACSGESPASTAQEAVSPSPAPSAVTPTKAVDATRLKAGLLTAQDLGSPWVAQKTVRSTGSSSEACPGVPNAATAAPPLASATAKFVEGSKETASLLISTVDSYVDAAGTERRRTAAAAARKACATYRDAAKLYVTSVSVAPPKIIGADAVDATIERIYVDQRKRQLAYVRHYLSARAGRLVVHLQYAFLTDPTDKTGRKLDSVARATQRQLTKAVAALEQS